MLISYKVYVFFVVSVKLVSINGRPYDVRPESENLSRSNTSNYLNFQNSNETKKRLKARSLTDDVLYDETEIVFPDSSEESPLPPIENPKCTAADMFCEEFHSYPHQHVEAVLKEATAKIEFYSGVDGESEDDLVTRFGPPDEDVFVCKSIKRIIFPKVGRNKNNQWRYIVNQEKADGFVQGIRIETCSNEGPCDLLGEHPNGFTTSCKQKYIYRRLLSLNINGKPVPDTFLIPSACCCSYKRDTDFLTNFRTR